MIRPVPCIAVLPWMSRDSFSVEARAPDVDGRLVGILVVVRQGRRNIEFFDPNRPLGRRWYVVRGSEWSVVHAKVSNPREGLGTRLYSRAAAEVRRRDGAFLSSDTIRSTESQGWWSRAEERLRPVVRFLGDRYVVNLRALVGGFG